VKALLDSDEFVDEAPRTVYAKLLDQGTYLCSPSTMYRILREHDEVRERRRQATHPAHKKPELIATRPNEVWSWDITKLHDGEVDLLLLVRDLGHLEPLRRRLDARPG
jgi:putative transposase